MALTLTDQLKCADQKMCPAGEVNAKSWPITIYEQHHIEEKFTHMCGANIHVDKFRNPSTQRRAQTLLEHIQQAQNSPSNAQFSPLAFRMLHLH